MEHIPNETKCQILSNLCAKDCSMISCVSKDLRIVSNSDYVWKRFIPKSHKVNDNYKEYLINIYNYYKDKCNISLPQITKYILLSFLALTFVTILHESISFDTEYPHTHYIRKFIFDYMNFVESWAIFIRDKTQDPVILSMDRYEYMLCTHTNSCPSINKTHTNILGLSLLFILYVVSYAILCIPYILILISHKLFIYRALLTLYNLVSFLTIYCVVGKFINAKKGYKKFIQVRKKIQNMM